MHDRGADKQPPAEEGEPPIPVSAWEKGVEEFNRQRYWHAHAHWETGWRSLSGPAREHLQALIQAAGAFHLLIEKSRERGACSLSRGALRKRARLRATRAMDSVFPRIEVPGLDAVLEAILAEKADSAGTIEAIRALRARLLYGLDFETMR